MLKLVLIKVPKKDKDGKVIEGKNFINFHLVDTEFNIDVVVKPAFESTKEKPNKDFDTLVFLSKRKVD